MFRSRLTFNDAKPIRHPSVFAIKRRSESDESSDYRSSLESPTTHCYVAGTRPKRTLPRRALSTGGVEIKSAVLCMDVQSKRLLQTGLCKDSMTPPRSKSATSFRTFGRVNPILLVPNIGTCRIYTPIPPSLRRFYDTSRQSLDKMDLDRSSSSRSITGKLNDLRLHLTVPYLMQKTVTLRKSVESFNCPHPQASPRIAPVSGRRTSRYISDEEMHIATSTEEDDSDIDAPIIRSIPSPATFFRRIRSQEVLGNAGNGENASPSTRRVLHQQAPSDRKKPMNMLQSSNYALPPPLVIIGNCGAIETTNCHQTKRVKRSRHGLTPTYR